MVDEARAQVAGEQFLGADKLGTVIPAGAGLGHKHTGLGIVSWHAVRDQAGHKLE